MTTTVTLNGYTQPVYVRPVVQDESDPDTLEVCRAIRMTKASVQHWHSMCMWQGASFQARLSTLKCMDEYVKSMQEEVGHILTSSP